MKTAGPVGWWISVGLVLGVAGCAAAPPAPAPPPVEAARPEPLQAPPAITVPAPTPPPPAVPTPPPGQPVMPPPVPPTPPIPPAPQPDAGAEDRELAARVEKALASDPALRDAVIEADARDGRVTLSGTVPTFRERTRAIERALQVPGVKSVRPRLVLQSQ
jgi:BON domain-containing protein